MWKELNILKSSQIAKLNCCWISGKQHENKEESIKLWIMNLDSFLNTLRSLHFKETRIRYLRPVVFSGAVLTPRGCFGNLWGHFQLGFTTGI